MSVLNKIKGETKIIMLSVIILTLSTIGFSYSVLFDIKSNSNNQIIQTGNLSVVYGGSSSSINNFDMLPMSDQSGLNSDSRSIIHIQNNGSFNSTFTITLSYDYNAFKERSNYEEGNELVPFEYLRMAIFEYDEETSQMNLISGIIDLGDVPIHQVESDFYNNSYAIFTSSVDKLSSGNSTKTLAIKVWIEEDATENISDYFVYLKVNIVSEVKESVMNYTLNGIVKDFNGDLVTAALVEFQNASYKGLTDGNGYFSLNDIREGTYLVNITYNGIKYSTTLNVVEAQSKNLNLFPTTHIIQSGQDLSYLTKTYSTTFDKIKNENNLTLDSKSVVLNEGTTYNIPKTYQLIGDENQNLGVLNINLGSNKNIDSMSLS